MADKERARGPEDIEDLDTDEEGAESLERKRFSGKKLMIFGGAGFALILIAGAGAYFMGFLGGGEEEHAVAEAEPAQIADVYFYELPEMLVNLNGVGQNHYLKLRVALELADPEVIEKLDILLPRIIDNFQVYLRELRLEDLSGSAGIYRLKEELLARVNTAVRPVQVRDVLFKEILVQ